MFTLHVTGVFPYDTKIKTVRLTNSVAVDRDKRLSSSPAPPTWGKGEGCGEVASLTPAAFRLTRFEMENTSPD